MREKMETAQSLCAMAACNSAFGDCREGEGYDLGKNLQSIGLKHLTFAKMRFGSL